MTEPESEPKPTHQPSKTYKYRSNKAEFFNLKPIKVSERFRCEILRLFENLDGKTEQHTFYRHMLQYVLFSSFVDDMFEEQESEGGEQRSLVCPHVTVAFLSGNKPYVGGFRSGPLLEDFSNKVLSFGGRFQGWNWKGGRARVIRPFLETEVLRLIQEECDRPVAEKILYFASNNKVNRSNENAVEESRKEALNYRNGEELKQHLLAQGFESHPADKLLEYLNNEPQTVRNNTLADNWPSVKLAAKELAVQDGWAQSKRLWLARTLIQIESAWSAYYTWVEKSPRIYTTDVTVHSLPRALRKVAFAGATELDLKAAQLAIIASQWGINSLNERLKRNLHDNEGAETDIWDDMLAVVGLSSQKKRYKPILKETVYSIIFGMEDYSVIYQLANGSFPAKQGKSKAKGGGAKNSHAINEGIGFDRAKTLIKHDLFKEILKAREEQKSRIENDGFTLDAFGNTVRIIEDSRTVESAMAYSAQSWEMKLMLKATDAVKQENRVHILSFLHDGLTVKFKHAASKLSQLNRILEAVNDEASNLEIYTRLEVEELPYPQEDIARHISESLQDREDVDIPLESLDE